MPADLQCKSAGISQLYNISRCSNVRVAYGGREILAAWSSSSYERKNSKWINLMC